MADIPSPGSYVKMNDVEIDNEKPVTTALFYKYGENVNKLIDDTGTLEGSIAPNYDYIYASTNFTWLYDGTSNRTYNIIGAITKTKANPVELFFPTVDRSGNWQAAFQMLGRDTAALPMYFFRSAADVITPNGSTNLSYLFESRNEDGSRGSVIDSLGPISATNEKKWAGNITKDILTTTSGTYSYGFYWDGNVVSDLYGMGTIFDCYIREL